ncbi:MAG: hypothetical protein ACP5QT_05500 [Brevinematia bacterium]
MKKSLLLLVSILMLVLISCSSSTSGDAYLFVEGVANQSRGGVSLYTELTNTGGTEGAFTLKTTEFYIAITLIKIKSREKDWVTIRDNSDAYPEEMVRGINLANGVKISPYDYNIFLIGYKANWEVKTSSTNIVNSSSENVYYAIFYNDPSIFNEISSQYPTASSTYWNSSFSVFAGDSKWLYLYFDTENIVKVQTNSSGEITNVYLVNPSLNIEVR